MGIRINFDNIINEIIGRTSRTGHIFVLGAQDCKFTVGKYICKNPQYKGFFAGHSPSGNIDTKDYFLSKGFTDVTTIDINDRSDVCLDLNLPLPEELVSVADWVGDFGTLEHVFNVTQGMANIHRMLKPSGVALHVSPFAYPYHGYFNFNPHFFKDFYLANGYKQIVETFEVSLYNPLYSRYTSFLPLFLFRSVLPFKGKSNLFSRIFRHFTVRFGAPAYVLQITAFQKPDIYDAEVKFPYDIWK